MLEIERKILEINKKDLVTRIKKLRPSPKKLFEGLVRVKYFDFHDGSIRAKKDLLRLREFVPVRGASYTELVYKKYKGIKKGCKYFEELEFVYREKKSFRDFAVFFKNLGFLETLYYEKKRTHFEWDRIKFEIDEHPKIPAFLEIEAPSPAHIDAAIKKLGLQKHEQTAESISELMKGKYPKINLNGLTFP